MNNPNINETALAKSTYNKFIPAIIYTHSNIASMKCSCPYKPVCRRLAVHTPYFPDSVEKWCMPESARRQAAYR